jgi:hypothetical protein
VRQALPEGDLVTDEGFTLGPPTREADFDSRCPLCGGEIDAGELIYFEEDYDMWVCLGCAP